MDYRYWWFLAYIFANGITTVGISSWASKDLKIEIFTYALWCFVIPAVIKVFASIIYSFFDIKN